MTDIARLRTLLGGPDTAWIIDRVRRRLEAGRGVGGTVTLQTPSDPQREAIGRLFGRRVVAGTTLTVRLPELNEVLRRAELCEGIVDAVGLLSGPIVDLRGRRNEIEDAWHDVFDCAARRPGSPILHGWLEDVRATGLLRRLSRGDPATGRRLLDQSLAVADRLPASGIPLAELAAGATGDSHALDLGQPVGTLAMRYASAIGAGRVVQDSLKRRDIWANVGVLCDELSAPALTLGLDAATSTPMGRALAAHAECGEPYRVSARQLLRGAPDFSGVAGRTVYVCENPTVVASAASQLGARCAALVCVEGQLKTAARLLLVQLAAAGARLMYHGDFDWGGLRIGNVVIATSGARPWRYSSADFRQAPPGAPLNGVPVPACWDSELEAAMRASGRAVFEEQVLASLLTDLAR